MNVSDSSLRNPPQKSDTSIIYSILQHSKVSKYFPEQILSKLLPFIYIYATQHQMQTELHGFNYCVLKSRAYAIQRGHIFKQYVKFPAI